jgi:hypothetical protein
MSELYIRRFGCAYKDVLSWVDVLFSKPEFAAIRRLSVVRADKRHANGE